MVENDKAAFRNMLDTVMALYGKPTPDTDLLKVWWSKLNKYEFTTVTKAFNNYVDRYKIVPTPAAIIDQCKVNPVPNYVHQLAKISDPETLQKNRERFKAIIEEFKNKPKPHPKAWAKKIVDNERNYPDIAVQLAREVYRAES